MKETYRCLVILSLMVFAVGLRAGPWVFVGGYRIGDTPTICLRGDGGSFWLKQGARIHGYVILEIDPDLRFVVIDGPDGVERLNLSHARDEPLEVFRSPPPADMVEPRPTLEVEPREDASSEDSFLEAVVRGGFSSEDAGRMLRDMEERRIAAHEIMAEEIARSGEAPDRAALERAQSRLAETGAKVILQEDQSGGVSGFQVVAWPHQPIRGEDGITTMVPLSEEQARSIFGEQFDGIGERAPPAAARNPAEYRGISFPATDPGAYRGVPAPGEQAEDEQASDEDLMSPLPAAGDPEDVSPAIESEEPPVADPAPES